MTNPTAADACGCSDYRVSRRALLRGAAAFTGAAVTTSLMGDVFTQTAFGNVAGGNVLVVVSLRGGADALSLVVPHGDQAYAAARPHIGIPTGTLLAKDSMFGLHPALAPLAPMWDAGTFGAVHAVGMPQPNRSHFAAMEEVEDADPGSAERRGWINRMVGLMGDPDPVRGMQLGDGVVPTALYGEQPTVALTNYSSLKLPGATGSWAAPTRQSLTSAWTGVDTGTRPRCPVGTRGHAAADEPVGTAATRKRRAVSLDRTGQGGR